MFKSKSSRAAYRAAKQLRLQQQQQELQEQQQEQPVAKQEYLENCYRTYSCIHCRAHLANHDELISKLFQGSEGRAYLFNKVMNVGCKQAVERQLLTGLHAVADIYCDSCETTLGWKYEQAFVPSQKYKEGKYIIELVHMLKENNWDLTSYNTRDLIEHANQTGPGGGCVKSRWAKLSLSSLDDNFGIGIGAGAGAGAGASSSNLNGSSDRRATRRRMSEGDNRKRRHISNVTENSEQIVLETSDNNTIRTTTTTTPNTLDNNQNNLTSESLEVIRDVFELSTRRSNKQMAHNHQHHQLHNHQTSNQRQCSTIAAHSINDNNRQLHAIDMSTITPPDGLELVERSLSRLQLESGQDNNHNDQRHPSTATIMISGQSLSASPKSSSTFYRSSRSPSDMSDCSPGAPGESGCDNN